MAMLGDLERLFGYNKSFIAKQCGFSPSIITAVDDGSRRPRWALEKLQQFYDLKTGAKPAIQSAPKDAVEQKLLELKERDPAAYESVKNTIDVLHDRISRGPDEVAKEVGRRAVEAVKQPGVVYGRRKRTVKSLNDVAAQAVQQVVDSVKKSSS